MNPNQYVPGGGNSNAKLVIIGEAPSYFEVQTKIPFTGPSGRELDKLLQDAGINRSETWLTNICKYPVPESPDGKKIPFQVRAKQAGINLDEQLTDLRIELDQIRPNCILA